VNIAFVVGASLSLGALAGCGPNELRKQAAMDAFCAAPSALPWAPQTKDVALYARRMNPDAREFPWIRSDGLYAPPDVAARGPIAGRVACLLIEYDILETQNYVAPGKPPLPVHRTRARTTLRIYEAKSGRLLSEDRATGPDPVAFEGQLRVGVHYDGAPQLSSIHTALRAAAK